MNHFIQKFRIIPFAQKKQFSQCSFDYNCHGKNWNTICPIGKHQSPINFP